MIHKLIPYFLLLIFSIESFAQIGIGTENPDPSSIIDIVSTEQGVLPPQMTEAVRTGMVLTAASEGLLVYQTDADEGFWYYDGIAWIKLTDGAASGHWDANVDDIYNNNTGHVGIGTGANADTPFHIKGNTILQNNGSGIVYKNDFSSGSVSYEENAGNTCTDGLSNTAVWNRSVLEGFGANMTDDHACIISDYCNQDQTLIQGPFTPTTNTINISFSYFFTNESENDSYTVTLYDETDEVVVATLVDLTSNSADTNYGGIHTVTAGHSYSLRFRYQSGNFDYAAEVDNILIAEDADITSGSYTFRLEDGTQGANYVLTSDANGNAYWAPYPTTYDPTPLQKSGGSTISNKLEINSLTEEWIHEYGSAKLKNGVARINLNKEFVESILVNKQNPLLVFLQEEGNTNYLFVIPDEDGKGFTVKEKNGGKSNAKFSYSVTARSKNYQQPVKGNLEQEPINIATD